MSKSKSKKMAKSKGKTIAAPTTATDLTITLSEDGTTLTGTVSPNAQWAGIQRFPDPTINDGAEALADAQRHYFTAPGEGVTTSGQSKGTGYYRVFTSDFDYNIHLSEFLFVP